MLGRAHGWAVAVDGVRWRDFPRPSNEDQRSAVRVGRRSMNGLMGTARARTRTFLGATAVVMLLLIAVTAMLVGGGMAGITRTQSARQAAQAVDLLGTVGADFPNLTPSRACPWPFASRRAQARRGDHSRAARRAVGQHRDLGSQRADRLQQPCRRSRAPDRQGSPSSPPRWPVVP